VQWVLVCHGLVTLLVVISFLCGQWPIFQGTFVERIHYFLTFGAYDYLLYSLSVTLLRDLITCDALIFVCFIGGVLGLCVAPRGPMLFSPWSISSATDPIPFYRFGDQNCIVPWLIIFDWELVFIG
jgi:hypothetical protein